MDIRDFVARVPARYAPRYDRYGVGSLAFDVRDHVKFPVPPIILPQDQAFDLEQIQKLLQAKYPGYGKFIEVSIEAGRLQVRGYLLNDPFSRVSPPLDTPEFDPFAWFATEVVGPLQRGELQ